jgi:long-chain acyl-CoA synthetase
VAIIDERGKALPLGEVGEIAVKGPQVMRGYWNAPEETAQVLTRDGWLRTGDIGRMDPSGFVHFIERRKDVIVVSGFKAFPAEIEAIVREHPGVTDVAAVGVPDARSGQAVALFVVRKDPVLTAEDLRSHCETRLAPYKRPRLIEFVEHLPVTALGKVLRRELRDEFAARVSAKVV